jgi:glycerol-3-phosphate cytidylyltransferase
MIQCVYLMKKDKKVIGFTCGAFDLTHAGHYLMFKEVRKKCDFLIVGLQMDPSVDRKDKNKPIQSLKERLIQLKACKYIDKIIIYKTEIGLYNLLKKLRPDVRFMGTDWKNKPNYSRDKLPEIKVIYNSRNHNYSTTNLRRKIIKEENKLV